MGHFPNPPMTTADPGFHEVRDRAVPRYTPEELASMKQEDFPGFKTFHDIPERDPNVDHPKHYNSHPSGVECIDIVEHCSFNIGNVIKYLWRADHKGATLEDLKKAAFYLDREIKLRSKNG